MNMILYILISYIEYKKYNKKYNKKYEKNNKKGM